MKTVVVYSFADDEILGEIPYIRRKIDAIMDGRDVLNLRGKTYRYVSFQTNWVSGEGLIVSLNCTLSDLIKVHRKLATIYPGDSTIMQFLFRAISNTEHTIHQVIKKKG